MNTTNSSYALPDDRWADQSSGVGMLTDRNPGNLYLAPQETHDAS